MRWVGRKEGPGVPTGHPGPRGFARRPERARAAPSLHMYKRHMQGATTNALQAQGHDMFNVQHIKYIHTRTGSQAHKGALDPRKQGRPEGRARASARLDLRGRDPNGSTSTEPTPHNSAARAIVCKGTSHSAQWEMHLTSTVARLAVSALQGAGVGRVHCFFLSHSAFCT